MFKNSLMRGYSETTSFASICFNEKSTVTVNSMQIFIHLSTLRIYSLYSVVKINFTLKSHERTQ